MKGIVFNEFLEMVESAFGEEMVDNMIDASELASGGAYTSVGTYPHEELIYMVVALHNFTGKPIPELVKTFGLHLASVFSKKYQDFFSECTDTLSFLKKIDNHIHVEVQKLYPDAELPVFTFDDSDPDKFLLHYESTRGFADLAQGLIEGCSQYYGESFDIQREDLSDGANTKVLFTLTATA